MRSRRSQVAAPGQSSEEMIGVQWPQSEPHNLLTWKGQAAPSLGLLLPGEDKERRGVIPKRSCWCVPRCLKRAWATAHTKRALWEMQSLGLHPRAAESNGHFDGFLCDLVLSKV